MNCSSCKHKESAQLVNYGELTATGEEIKIASCFAGYYDEDLDECLCGNFEEGDGNDLDVLSERCRNLHLSCEGDCIECVNEDPELVRQKINELVLDERSIKCFECGKEVEGYGIDCGCRGLPINTPVCSDECWINILNRGRGERKNKA